MTAATAAVIVALALALWGAPATASGAAPTADAGGPYVIAEGDTLPLSASGSTDPELDALAYAWDLDNDGFYDDATGENPVVAWSLLSSLGVDDDGVHTVAVQVDDGTSTSTDTASLTIANTAPTVSLVGPETALAGQSYDVDVVVDDPGADSVSSWVMTWGDGTVTSGSGAPGTQSHTYTASGLSYGITIEVTDEDGTWSTSNILVSFYDSTEKVGRFTASTGAKVADLASAGGALDGPYDVTVGPDGLIYVTGVVSDTVVRYDPADNSYVSTFVGGGSGGLNEPKGLAFGPDGNLYVASFATGQILRYDGTTGAFIDVFVPAGTVTGPTDVVFAPDGSMLVSDNGNDNIERYDGTTGTSLGVFATASPGDGPAGMTFGNGNLFVAMIGPGVVREFNGTTGALVGTFVSSGLSSPHHPVFGPDGDLWVTDYTTEQVKRFDGSTGAALGARITESSPAGPFGAAFLPDKQVRVTDGFVVNSTGNAGDVSIGDGVCDTGGANASGADECTLRAAIEEANAASNADLVAFDIPVGDGGHSAGIWTIAVSGSPFTWVSETLTVDGTTAPTYSSTPVIVLDGSALSGSDVGLGFATDAHDSTVTGLSIVSFPDDAISVGVDRMHVHSNHLGVLPDGVTAPGSGSENLALWAGTDALIENNLIGSAVNANIALTGATSGAVIRANIVGTDATGALDFGGAQAIWSDAAGPNLVGGADPADGNVLANSTWINVQLTSGSVTLAVVGNDIYGATTLGIDLNEDGVTANDALDGDSGANDLLNFPVPTAAPETAGTVDLAFDLDVPAGTYRIDVFANPSGTHPSGNGEGEDFIGQASVVHPGGGSSSFVIQVPATAGDVLTTTATEVTGAESYGATSEFSIPITVTGTTGPPVADAGGPYNIAEGDAVTLDGSGSVDPQLDPLTYEWDLDNDGTYGDVTGEGPTVSWSTLQAFGVDDDGVHTIGLRVDDGDETATDTGTIIVANTEPTITVTGDGTALIDQSYSITISATDPGADTITAYRIDWGDTTFESVAAGLPATESHTYTAAALRHITVEVTDEDGEWTTADLVVPNADVADLITRHDLETGTQVAQLDPTSPVNTPYGMTIGPDGHLYVPGYSSNSVERYDLATNTWIDTFVDGSTGGLTSANSVAFTPAGNLLVGDWTDDDILEFDGTTGAFVGTFASGGGLNGPAEMLYGPDGNLYVASALTNQVLRYDGATGAFIDAFVAAGSGGLSYLEAMAWSSDGELLVGSSSTDEVKRYDGTTGAYLGNAVAAGIGGLDSPLGISVAPDGDILVSSNVNNLVKRYAASTFTYLGDAVTTGLDAPYVSALVPDHSITVKAPLTVNSTDDDADATAGDGVCDTGQLNVAGDPECTLRAAIMQSNATGGTDGIVFDIPATDGGHAGGVWMIGVLSSLPSITDPVILDATTQTGFTTAPIVELDGGGTVGTAIDVNAGSSTIRGLVIHSFTNDGIDLDVAGGNTIAGNWIGIRANGGTAAGVGDDGIAVRSGSDGNMIGGPTAADRNVISANGGEGILLDDSNDNVVEGNYLGTDASGLVDRGNGDEGLDVNGSDNVVVRDNVISGNGGEGLQILSGNGGVYTGNLIGVGADGSTPIGNTGDGITVNFGSSVGVVIGGTGTGDGNTIAHNGDEGISIFDSLTDDVAVLGNSIHSNTALGLDLLGDGVTANDAGDADGGVNDLMNFPVITALSISGGTVTVDFELDATAGDYRIEAFTNPSGADGSGYGEGETFVQAATITHTGSGSEAFQIAYSGALGDVVTLTSTEEFGGGAFGSSSEFSAAATVVDTYLDLFGAVALDGSDGSLDWSTSPWVEVGEADGTASGRARIVTSGSCTATSCIEIGGDEISIAGYGWSRPVDLSGAATVELSLDVTRSGSGTALVVEVSTDGLNWTTLATLTSPSSPTYDISAYATDTAAIRVIGSGTPDDATYWYVDNVTVSILASAKVTVNSTGDSGDATPGDNVCDTGGTNSEGDPECTLRAAIEEANASAGIDTIEFAIPTTDGGYSASPLAYTLTPGSAYPSISTAMTIDASTQPGWTGDPIIELDGTSATGSSAGIYVLGDDTTVRGFIVHSFPDEGLEIDGSVGGGNRNTFTNNWVGFDAALTSRPNADYGILVTDVATDNVIGGTAADDANVIGNSVSGGIILRDVGTAGNVVIGNIVGLAPDAATSAPNSGGGVIVSQGASQNRIGGATPAEANTISATEGVGVLIAADAGADNSILGNAISENKELGIDLVGGTEDAAGVTTNDAGDVDAGPNDLLNHPAISEAAHDAGTVTVDFGIDVPAGTYRIEAFTNPTSTDGSGHGEGELFQTATSVVHTGSGTETFQLTYAGAIGDEVALTATEDLGAGAYGSTSEFSGIATVVPGTTVALVNSTGDAADAVPGDGTCDTGDTNSEAAVECTLRAAIEEANATPSIDTISFSIPTSDPGWTSGTPGFWTIGIATTTATVTSSVTIDGTTQPGWIDDPVIAIDDTGSSSSAIRLAGAGSSVRGLAVGGFTYGVYLDADAISVTGNWIGFGADGSSGYNTYGIYTTPSATNAVIGTPAAGNVIGHASTEAVRVRADDVVVEGNDLGLSPVGDAADIDSGVVVSDNAQRVRIGGTGAGEGNRITNAASNQDEVGVSVQSSANDVSILGNLIWNNVTNVDLNRDGRTPNDALDADSGPNDLLNHPTTAVTGAGSGTVDIDVTLDVPAGTYRIEIFDNSAFPVDGLGAAEELVHAFTVTHTGSGDETFSTSYADATPDLLLSATATEDLGGGTYGATSELSPIRSAPLSATVNSTRDASDADPTDGVCDTGATNSAAATECTLRAAIQEANVHPGATISFALPTTEAGYDAGDGFWTISVSGDLPDLASDAIVIDASKQTGYDGTRPLVLVLDDGAGSDTFELEGDDQVLRAIAVGDPGDEPIQLEADRTVIDSVWLGIDPAGNPVGGAGSFREGIIIYHGSVDGLVTNSRISGFDSGVISNSGTVGLTITGTEIFGNRNAGVAFNNTGTISVVGNSIYDNVGLGIDLAAHDGIPLANDAGDADSGSNDLLNHPVVTGVTVGAGTLDVAFDLDAPAATYRIEFFDNDSPDPSGHGEGQTFLAAATIVHPGGSASYLQTVSGAPGDVLTLTSTVDLGAGDYGPTSEFSPWWAVEAVVVNSTGDAADAVAGDGGCNTGGLNANGDPECTLRAAIEEANANASLGHIVFSIAANDPGHVYYQDDAATGFGTPVATTAEDHAIADFDADYPSAGFSWWQIAPATSLPVVTSPVTIDASTQPGHEPNTVTGTGVLDAVLRIEIDNPGVSLGYGLEISAGSTIVRGLVVDEGSNAAIRMTTAGGNTLTGSWLGPDITGDRNGSGTGAGLFIEPGSDGNTIGGSGPADRNVISHNSWAGIWLDASGTQVVNNYIGFDVLGSTVTGSSIQDNGIWLDGNTNQIGVAGAGNLFGRNIDSSIWAPGGANVIQANTFVDSWDTSVTFSGPGGGNLLGGAGFGQGNLITLTTSSPAIGVSVDSDSTGNSILANSITANEGLGIDLGASYGDGVTANDTGDVDTGANDLLNFPDITSAVGSSGTVTVTFDLDVPVNGDGYRIEFFANPTEGADASGYGEGQAFLGSTDVAGAVTAATFVYPGAAGDVVTATATAKTASGFGSTSEFSAATTVTDGPVVVNASGDASDATPGDGLCDTGATNADGDPECTLRAAIEEANAGPVDEIEFAIPSTEPGHGAGVWSIAVATELPEVTAPVRIDASTQTGSTTPDVALDGSALSSTSEHGISLGVGSDASSVRGLAIVGFPGAGLWLEGSNDHVIAGNHLGIGPDGDTIDGNAYGAYLTGSSNTVIGGGTAADRNVISGNTSFGVAVYNNISLGLDSLDTTIVGNYIGTDATGMLDRGNTRDGLFIVNGSSRTTVGGPTAADANVISGNGHAGIYMGTGSMADGVIEGNLIGVSVDQSTALPNDQDGIELTWSSRAEVRGNVIGASGGDGVSLSSADDVTLVGNTIGTNNTGSATWGVGGHGVLVDAGSDGGAIGGTSAGDGNTIIAAGLDGVSISGNTTSVLATVIRDSADLGIDLGDDGVTANDLTDADTGPNDLLNFPVLTGVVAGAADLTVDFDLDAPAGTYRIELFGNPGGADPTDHGEGQVFVDAATVVHTGSGVESFTETFSGTSVELTATATEDLVAGSYGATSEFSAALAVPGQGTVSVNSTGDAGDADPGDGLCDTGGTNADGDPECTLRAAIEEANSSVVDTVTFAIPTTDGGHSAGVWTIAPSSGPFVDVTAPITVDGTTQAGWTANPIIGLDGTAYTPTPDDTDDGLDLVADDSTVAGLAIYGFADEQVKVAADRVTVRSSWLGLDPTGTVVTAAATTTTPHVFQVSGDDFTFGGPTPADGNVVASSADDAVITSTSTGAVVENNRFGVAADGITPLASPGSDYALRLRSGSSTVVRDNQFGNLPGGAIRVDGSATATIVGNLFGTDATLVSSLPISNALQVRDAATVRFGGTAADDANTVRNATGDAVDLRSSSTGTLTVLGNSIVGSGGLAFDMNEDGVTANDAGDVDTGPNDLLNFGEIRHARSLLGSVIVDLDLDVPAGDYRIEVFTNPSGADPSGYGEAEVFQSGTTVTHAGAGIETLSVSYPGAVGDVIAVSVTEDLGGGSYGATSELSSVFTVTDAAVTTVNSTGDAGDDTPGDGRCDTLADNSEGDAECTLRAAIEEANASLVVDTIEFAIPATDAGHSSGVWTVSPTVARLDFITSAVTIDGTTQPGYIDTPVIVVDGGSHTPVDSSDDGLHVEADNTTVRGLSIVNWEDDGIHVRNADGVLVTANWIGVLPDGTSAPNRTGVDVWGAASNTTIGGAASTDGNVIDPEASRPAIEVHGAATTTTVQNNRIGVAADGLTVIGAADGDGIDVFDNASTTVVVDNQIGGVVDAVTVRDDATDTAITGNTFGTDPSATIDLSIGTALQVASGSTGDVTFGGTTAGDGNVVRNTTAEAIGVDAAATGTTAVLGNSLFASAGLGIDLGSDGVTANDAGDVDIGANDLLNFPTIVNVQRVAGDLVVDLQLDVAAGDHRIELFGNTTSDPSGHGEGETFLGGATVTHTGSGAETFQVTVTSPATILTATTTADLGSGAYGPTSEFSAAVPSPDLVIVNSTADAADAVLGDGQCDTGGTNALGAPECTFRAAIEEANDPTTPVDTIWFAIPVADGGHDAGVWTVAPATALPQVTEPVVIDGATQPGYAANSAAAPLPLDNLPVIEIDGANAGDGVHLAAGAAGSTVNAVTIGGFSGGGNVGVEILADDVTITGSVVGLHADGVTDNPNAYGILVNADRATIGGATPAARNVIAGSQNGQIQINGGVDVEILGNVIGADATTLAVPGGWGTGVQAWGGDTITIGSIAAPNVIAGGPGDWGIETGASNVTIEGNLIGTDATYSADLGDWQAIGAYDTTTVTGNVIGNFAEGIGANGSDILIVGNFIGTDPTGTIDLGNTGFGVELRGATANVTVGGTTGADANTIANNGGAGVDVRANTVDPAILINTIRDNGGLGIDHDGDGVSPNDTGDADGLPNAPVVSAAVTDGGVTTLEFGLDRAAGTYRIDVYENPSGADPSGNGEGETHVATFDVVHAGGDQTYSQPITGAAGAVLSATATATGPHRSTSEFSNAITAVDEASQTLVDESVRRSDAIQLRGATAGQPGLVGDAIDLPGASSRVRGPALDITTGSLTLSAAVRPDALSAAHAVISKLDSSGDIVYELGIDGTTGEALAAVRLTGVTVTARGGTVAAGTWHSLAAVWNGADLVLFVDGVEADRVAAVGVLATDPSTVVTIGNRATATTPFDGSIDQVVVAHDAASAAEVAAAHRATDGTAGYVTVGAEQTSTPGAWSVSGTQTRSGSFAVQAPPTTGVDAAAWLVATGIDEPGLVFGSWWWISTDTGVDLDAGTRAGWTPVDQFEAALTSPSGWELRRRTGVSETVDATAAGAPSIGTWMRVEIWTDQLGHSRILIDGLEVTGWTTQGSPPISGSAGLRTGALLGGEDWFIDDATARKLITPEPLTSLSSLDRN